MVEGASVLLLKNQIFKSFIYHHSSYFPSLVSVQPLILNIIVLLDFSCRCVFE